MTFSLVPCEVAMFANVSQLNVDLVDIVIALQSRFVVLNGVPWIEQPLFSHVIDALLIVRRYILAQKVFRDEVFVIELHVLSIAILG